LDGDDNKRYTHVSLAGAFFLGCDLGAVGAVGAVCGVVGIAVVGIAVVGAVAVGAVVGAVFVCSVDANVATANVSGNVVCVFTRTLHISRSSVRVFISGSVIPRRLNESVG
jgi:hypothetical protein